MGKVAVIAASALFSLAVVIGGFWLNYVYRTATPYDEIGIELNSRMPRPLREWACRRLQERHGRVIPPYGCADFESWPTVLPNRR